MSIQRQADLPETTVENRAQYAKALHRPHGAHDEPVPACGERDRPEATFKYVPTERLLPFRTLCQNPACFGDDGTPDEGTEGPTCPRCGEAERDRRTVEGRIAVVDPCGCEIALLPDGGQQLVDACPECESADLHERSPESPQSVLPADAPGYLCKACRHEFDEPVQRPSTEQLSGLSKTLAEADPDDLATDGGAPDPDAFRIPTIDDLDAMRVAHGLSQKELSRRAGCEPDRFNHILHHDIDPQTATMRAFLDVLQAAEPQAPDDVERRGPKPRPSTLAGQLDEADPDVIPDGGLRFTTTDNIFVSDHAREMWAERFPDADLAIGDAWREAEPIEHPTAPLLSGKYARCWDERAVMIAQRHTLLTVFKLANDPATVQREVRLR